MTKLDDLMREAGDEGIEKLGDIIIEVLRQRNAALTPATFNADAAVFWSHLLWWLNTMKDGLV